MPRRESSPGFGARVRRVRERLGFVVRRDFAEKLGVIPETIRGWEVNDAAPAMATLKRCMRLLGVAGWKDLVLWLADGSDDPAPPAWLDDRDLDPFVEVGSTPPGGGGGPPRTPAMPAPILQHVDAGRQRLRELARSGSANGGALRALADLEDALAPCDAAMASRGTPSSSWRSTSSQTSSRTRFEGVTPSVPKPIFHIIKLGYVAAVG